MPFDLKTITAAIFCAAALCAAVAPAARAQPPIAGKTCSFYTGENYSGDHFSLYKDDMLVSGEGAVTEKELEFQRMFHKGRDFIDARWTGEIKSTVAAPNCSAFLSAGVRRENLAGEKLDYGVHVDVFLKGYVPDTAETRAHEIFEQFGETLLYGCFCLDAAK